MKQFNLTLNQQSVILEGLGQIFLIINQREEEGTLDELDKQLLATTHEVADIFENSLEEYEKLGQYPFQELPKLN